VSLLRSLWLPLLLMAAGIVPPAVGQGGIDEDIRQELTSCNGCGSLTAR
jgi:hypothetical protein